MSDIVTVRMLLDQLLRDLDAAVDGGLLLRGDVAQARAAVQAARQHWLNKPLQLWRLRPCDVLPQGRDPWRPPYDTVQGMVVCATDAQEARQYASEAAGDENNQASRMGLASPWLLADFTTITLLGQATPGTSPGVVQR